MINSVLLLLAILAVFPGLFAIGICWRLRAAADSFSRLRNAVVRHPLLCWAAWANGILFAHTLLQSLAYDLLIARSNGAEQITGSMSGYFVSDAAAQQHDLCFKALIIVFGLVSLLMFGLGFSKRKEPLFQAEEKESIRLKLSLLLLILFFGLGNLLSLPMYMGNDFTYSTHGG